MENNQLDTIFKREMYKTYIRAWLSLKPFLDFRNPFIFDAQDRQVNNYREFKV